MNKRFILKSQISNDIEAQKAELMAWFNEFKKYAILLKLKSFYDVGENIGNGTFSKVYESTHLLTGEKYAIKTIEKRVLARTQKNFVSLIVSNSVDCSSVRNQLIEEIEPPECDKALRGLRVLQLHSYGFGIPFRRRTL